MGVFFVTIFYFTESQNFVESSGLGAKSQNLSSVAPPGEKVGYYFQSGTCLGASETHVLLRFLWSIFYKWPVITVTQQTLKKAAHNIQD